MKICMIGSGSWGLALSKLLFENGHEVKIWSKSEEEVNGINNEHKLDRFLPGIIIPDDIKATCNMEEAISGSEVVILAVPSVAIRECSKNISKYLDNQIVVNVAKGLESGTQKRLSEVIREEL